MNRCPGILDARETPPRTRAPPPPSWHWVLSGTDLPLEQSFIFLAKSSLLFWLAENRARPVSNPNVALERSDRGKETRAGGRKVWGWRGGKGRGCIGRKWWWKDTGVGAVGASHPYATGLGGGEGLGRDQEPPGKEGGGGHRAGSSFCTCLVGRVPSWG